MIMLMYLVRYVDFEVDTAKEKNLNLGKRINLLIIHFYCVHDRYTYDKGQMIHTYSVVDM